MRWETAGKKEKKLGDLSSHGCPCGNHNRGNEICKVNWKSHPELTSTDRDRIVPNKLPSSDDRSGKIDTVDVTDPDSGNCKMAVGAESGKTKVSKDSDSDRNKTVVVNENKENEADITIANKVIVTQREKDLSKRQEKQRDLSDDDSSNEDSDSECAENKDELTRKPVLNINIPCDSVSDVENQLKNLAITQSGDGKGDLCERSPMGSERHRVRGDLPYPQVSSQLRYNGGGIVAESPAPTDCLYTLSPSTIVHLNINELQEANNNVLLPSGPEYPFGEASSSPEANNNFLPPSSQGSPYGEESSSFPVLSQKDLDVWLNINGSSVDKGSADTTTDSQLGQIDVRDDSSYFHSPNIRGEQNEMCPVAVWPIPPSNSLLYRQTESIASLSSPSSGSRYSSECSPSSSPVPSLADSVTGKSDSDTENELWKIESNLKIGYVNQSDVPSCCAHSVNDGSLNKLVTSSAPCGHPCYPLASDPYTCYQPSHSDVRLPSVQPAQSLITAQSVHPANPAVSVHSATGMLLAEPAMHPALPANCLHLAQPANSLQPTQRANSLQPAQTADCLQAAQPLNHFQPAQSANRLQPALSANCLQLAQSANHLQAAPSANRLQSAHSVNHLQAAQPASCLHPAQSPSSLQSAQQATCSQPVQSTNCQPAQPVRGMQQALAVSVRHTQSVPPTISVQPSCQSIQLASSTNTQTLIIQSNVQPFPHVPPHRPNIQQGPVIPETVAVSARERIAAKVDKAMKDRVVMTLAKLPDDQLSRGDKHGDTQLMILVCNEHLHKLEQIYVMVSRLKNIPGALIARNAQNQSALSLACLFLHDMPLVARFIAEVMLEKGLPVNEVYDDGNTLLHMLCSHGDSHVGILAELLSMKDGNNAPCFDINQHNHKEGTPLHVAVKKHSKKFNCSRTVAFLLSQGADILAKEHSCGLTVLHLAIKESCDPLLVQILLQAAERRNINLVSNGDYQGDTALHYVALRNDIAVHQQRFMFQLLVRYGAVSNCCGSRGRTPLALVSAERKREIQKILHRR